MPRLLPRGIDKSNSTLRLVVILDAGLTGNIDQFAAEAASGGKELVVLFAGRSLSQSQQTLSQRALDLAFDCGISVTVALAPLLDRLDQALAPTDEVIVISSEEGFKQITKLLPQARATGHGSDL